MKNILVPTDFSENAYNALLYAVQMFQNEPCKFYLLHSFESEVARMTTRIDIGRSEEVVDNLFKESDEQLIKLKRKINLDSEGMGHQFETVSSSKILTTEVNYLIKGMAIEFVIMGTKGQTGAARVLLGSNTVKVIKKIKDCPLLVIPNEIDYTPIKKVAFATGFHHPYHPKETDAILSIVKLNKAVLDILYITEEEKISEEQKENVFQLRNQLTSIHNELCWLSMGPTKTDTISDYVYKNNIDLLAMIYYKHGFIKSLFRESIVKKVSQHPGLPFLMIPAMS